MGLLDATEGEALVWGKDLGKDDQLRKKIGVLLEYDGLYERMSAYRNLDYFARLYDVKDRERKIRELLEFTGLAERRNDPIGKFSRGMRRKLGLAPEAQKIVRDLIRHLSREKITIFLNSHDLDEVQRICSSVAILQKGEIRIHDSMENLKKRMATPVVQIIMSSEEAAEKALSLLRSLDFITECSRQKREISASMDGGKTPSALLSLLVENGLEVEEVKRATRSLEDLYLEITHPEQSDE